MKHFLRGGKAQLAVWAAFFSNGAAMATWVSRLPSIQNKLGLSEGSLGLVLLGSSMGTITALLLAGNIIEKLGSSKVTLISALVLCGSLPLLSLAPDAVLLFFLLFFFGGAMSLMDVAMNEQAVLVERKTQLSLMSTFHGGFSIGAMAGAMIGAGMATLPSNSLVLHFALAAVLFSAINISIFPYFLPAKSEHHEKRRTIRIPERALWALGVIAFCSMITEGAMGDWSAIYLTNILQTSSSYAALGYAVFSLMMTIGRFGGDSITSKWGMVGVIRTGSLIATTGLVAIILTHSPTIAIMGFGLVGLGVANVIPLVYKAAGNSPGIPTGTGIAGVASIGYVGSLIGPPLMGAIAEKASLRASFTLIAILISTLTVTASSISRHGRNETKIQEDN